MRFFTTTAVAVAAVRVLAEVTVRAATCPVEAKDKCRCSETGNVTTSSLLDIGCYFKYPYASSYISIRTVEMIGASQRLS